jgi:glycogen operon protein
MKALIKVILLRLRVRIALGKVKDIASILQCHRWQPSFSAYKEHFDPVSSFTITSGRNYPLGATYAPESTDVLGTNGTNFALFSAHAEKVELCLFDESGDNEIQRLTLPEYSDDVFHGFVENLKPGTLYGYRVYGPFEPHNGHRFNPAKLLLDPYAKALHGELNNSALNFSYQQNQSQSKNQKVTGSPEAEQTYAETKCPQQDLTLDTQDNAHTMPKCVVIDTQQLTLCQSHPKIRQRDTILYELHVKGFTAQHPDVPIELQGTFAGLADKSVIEHLLALGVTSIELMPVHQFLNEAFVEEKELSNYWGYNSICFFAPHTNYCSSVGIAEFRAMVETFHQHGIEVILDVVYNHSAEGNELGPTLSFKGIDNASYYRLQSQDQRFYENYSGCGNSLNITHPRVLQLITDSLRYWVQVMGVDGFRFDLATILGRENPHFNANNAFFSALKQDPVLAQTKLIAEPWDIGQDGYQLGCFDKNWLEWNDRFRDTCRRFWRGDQGIAPEFAARLHGSSDIFEQASRRPSASVNFITSHDGFTLEDLVSYQAPDNLANGENNRDGHGSNFSCNFGHEGVSDNATIVRLRARQKRNLLTTLFISQGTPMLLAGDEMSNSQMGNNNAYCQDNEISWLDWSHLAAENSKRSDELAFVKQLIQLRKQHPLLNRSHYHHGQQISDKTGLKDIDWLNCRGKVMQTSDWQDQEVKCFAMLLAQTDEALSEKTENAIEDDALLVIFNAHPCEINYQLPVLNGYWQQLNNTADEATTSQTSTTETNTGQSNIIVSTITVAAHSCLVLSFFGPQHQLNIDSASPESNLTNNSASANLRSDKQREA